MKLILWGAGGHGRVVADVARSMAVFEEILFVDDCVTGMVGGIRVGASSGLSDQLGLGRSEFLISIGNNAARARLFEITRSKGFRPAILVHCKAEIASEVKVGLGTVVMANVAINPEAEIGANCIINTSSVIEHHCRVGDHTHVAPGAVLTGGVALGRFVTVGAGAVILPGCTIGDGATVGAGAVVRRDVRPGATVVGVPARAVRTRSLHVSS